MDISIVIPVYNEFRTIPILYKRIKETMSSTLLQYEIIFINDGSTDDTLAVLKKQKNVTVINFRRNFGQTAALDAGFKHAQGSVIITMDGDLQNDPADIPRLLTKLNKGYDVVSGWRVNRKDSIEKILFSKIADIMRHIFLSDTIHDSGCSLKAYRRECFVNFDLYGEMHRYIPALLGLKGFQIGEVPVHHYRRRYGQSKYNTTRLFKGFLDLLNVWFWRKFQGRPLHLFGGLGFLFSGIGFLGGCFSLFQKVFFSSDLSSNFLAIASMLLFVIGIQFFISGLMADIAIKTFHKQHGRNYSIKEIVKT